MFSTEFNGYNRQEVDKYIEKLKSDYEASLMEERLKLLESEKKLLDFNNQNSDMKNREKSIMSAIDNFKRMQDEGNNNIKTLHYEQIRMIQEELQELYDDLCIQFPSIQGFDSFKSVFADLEKILNQATELYITSPTKTENDSMRILLTKLRGYRRGQDNPREVRISRNDEKNKIRPVCDMKPEDLDDFDTLADKFLSTAPEEHTRTLKKNDGFDLKEAINPKLGLAEIMKAFDFFNEDLHSDNG